MKHLVRELAKREAVTESALVKQLLEVVLRTSALAGFPAIEELDRPNRDARLYIRLEPEDRMLLTGRATQRGMRSATYVSVLVRSHLRSVAPLPKQELLALKRSVAELSELGRTLHHVASAIEDGKSTGPGLDHVRAMLKIAEGLRNHFKALLKANVRSWEQGRAETSQ